ncbi:leucyl-cystinyl aminopeptidase-like isoform X2 [Sitophilus oryzae]|uniref:Leucyl-cystinyl aminopeptidase-like isoform X2 n=1 Tax=Sitophilus oryzae TaxID=7048 RepID=A0A6J2YFQ8_SITOR|nr:leucyl-cystinyl aminopeptidase-like isoform X2 [Sitophilus oryzae]
MKLIFSYAVLSYFLLGSDAHRLSRLIEPINYNIKLRPNLDSDYFNGVANITLKISGNHSNITLHSSCLNMSKAHANGVDLRIKQLPYERISVAYRNGGIFQPGVYSFFFKFVGKYGVYGLNKTEYGIKNDTRVIVVNEFEPYGARKAFPCFDEPYFKATFSIRLVSPNDSYYCVSNMPQIRINSSSDGTVYHFATTPKMSTYLVSLAVTDSANFTRHFQYRNRNFSTTIYSYNASNTNNNEVIEFAQAALEIFTDYTGIEYPLPKLDMIEYKKAKGLGTELWGLIQFKMGLLNQNLETYNKHERGFVIFHEVTHSWFGNLVTNDGWNHLWLQEGLTTYMSTKYFNQYFNVTLQPHNVFDLSNLFYEDKSKPLPLVTYPDQITEKDLFRNAVYSKGGAIFQVLETVMGPEAFQNVIRRYLKKFSYGSTTTDDIIKEFSKEKPELDIKSFMETHLYQSGLPVLSLDESSEGYIVTQHDIYNGTRKWTIPISYMQRNVTGHIWFDKDSKSVTIPRVADAGKVAGRKDWILLNIADSRGMYAVNYTEKIWDALLDSIEDLPDDEVENLAENTLILYMNEVINCDVILNLQEILPKCIKSTFRDPVLTVLEDIICYPDEFQLAYDKIKGNIDFNEDVLMLRGMDCIVKDVLKNESDAFRGKCRSWIRANYRNGKTYFANGSIRRKSGRKLIFMPAQVV